MLIALGYGLMLPAVAILHVRHARVRESGAILATVAGTAVVAVGLAGSVNVDLRPAALLVLGMWWWTSGKLWVETRVLPTALGVITAGLGLLAIVGAFLEPASVLEAIVPGYPAADVWTALRVALGAWLIGLAFALSTRSGGSEGGSSYHRGGLRGA